MKTHLLLRHTWPRTYCVVLSEGWPKIWKLNHVKVLRPWILMSLNLIPYSHTSCMVASAYRESNSPPCSITNDGWYRRFFTKFPSGWREREREKRERREREREREREEREREREREERERGGSRSRQCFGVTSSMAEGKQNACLQDLSCGHIQQLPTPRETSTSKMPWLLC